MRLRTGDRDSYGSGRWCEECNVWHGPLYVCPRYPEEIQIEVRAKSDAFRANLADPAWQAEQRKAGVPQVAIELFKIMGGVE